jgi:hypothetical protein
LVLLIQSGRLNPWVRLILSGQLILSGRLNPWDRLILSGQLIL